MKKLTILPLVLLLILMAAVAVYADKPGKGNVDFEDDWLVFDCADFTDYDFEVWDNNVGRFTWAEYYDKDGNIVWYKFQAKGVDHVYNKRSPDHYAEGPFVNTCHRCREIPDEPGWWIGVWTGVDWNIQLPGEGTVYHVSGFDEEKWYGDFGNQVIQLKRAGLDKMDYEALCRYLNDK